MRRILAVVLAALLLAGCALAEEVDLGALTDEALLALLGRVQQEVVDRRIAKSAVLHEGKYTVGVDIPVGAYNIDVDFHGSMWMDIYIYDETGKEQENFTVFASYDDGKGHFYANLKNGYTLRCTSDITLTVYTGLVFQ